MDRFFDLLGRKELNVTYDEEYNSEWIDTDTDENRKLISEHIIELVCFDRQLTELPDLPNVKLLNCSNNQLTTLPEIPNVRNLYCSNNQLTKLGQVSNVQILHCSENLLTVLPEIFNIQKLQCSFNKLTMLPELPNVKELYCSYNQLTELPELPNIQWLRCYGNNLFSNKLEDWKIIWKFKKSLIRVYVVPKFFSKWKLTTIRNRLSVEHKEAIICHPKTYYVRELYNENN